VYEGGEFTIGHAVYAVGQAQEVSAGAVEHDVLEIGLDVATYVSSIYSNTFIETQCLYCLEYGTEKDDYFKIH
jgi:hypothetical protein